LAVVVDESEPGVLWVICTPEEANEKIFPLLGSDEAYYWRNTYNLTGGTGDAPADLRYGDGSKKHPAEIDLVISGEFHPSHFGSNAAGFLVSVDFNEVVPFWPGHPYTRMWNGESPFLKTELQEARQLEDFTAPTFLGPIEGMSDYEWDRVSGGLPKGKEPGPHTDKFMRCQRRANGAPLNMEPRYRANKFGFRRELSRVMVGPGNTAPGRSLWGRLAKETHPDAINEKGVSLSRDGKSRQAEKLWKKAAKLGNLDAKANLGQIVIDSNLWNRRYRSYLDDALDARHPGILNTFGSWLADNVGLKQAQCFWEAAAEVGDLDAHRNLGKLARERGEESIASEWERAAEQPNISEARRLLEKHGSPL